MKKIPWQILPAFVWFVWFLVIPLGIVLIYSFLTRGTYGGVEVRWTLDNYARTFDPIYLRIVWNSLALATITTVVCLLLGYPIAYAMATARPQRRSLLLFLLVIPFLTNFIVRAYSVKLLLGHNGPINQLLLALGWIEEPLVMTNSYASVVFGMVINYLPFMIIPLYVALEKFDFTLLEAARDLGGRSWDLGMRVLLPITRHAIFTGILLVFMPAFGEFVIPDLFGGAKTMLVGSLITEQFLKARDWPFGAALSLLLLVFVGVSLKFQAQESRR